MNSCCGNNSDESKLSSNDSQAKDVEPKNLIERFFWKIGKNESEKQSREKRSCCS